MFSIWVTVATTWSLKAMSEIFLLFLAMCRKRKFGPKPNPARSSCRKPKRAKEFSSGEKLVNLLLVVCRLLLKSKEIDVPVGNAWEKFALKRVVFVLRVGTPLS